MQFMSYIHNSIKNDMINMSPESEQKKEILEFIKILTTKIYEEPSLVDLLFTESRNGDKKGSYIPLQILLLLLIREDVTEKEQ